MDIPDTNHKIINKLTVLTMCLSVLVFLALVAIFDLHWFLNFNHIFIISCSFIFLIFITYTVFRNINRFKIIEIEKQLRSVVENAPEAIIITNAITHKITFANPTSLKIFGFNSKDIKKHTFQDLLASEDLYQSKSSYTKLLNGEIIRSDLNVKNQESTVFLVDTNVIHVKFKNISHLVWYLREIKDKRRTERLLSARTALLECSTKYTDEIFLQEALDIIASAHDSTIAFFHKVEADQKTLVFQGRSKKTHFNIDKAGVWVDCVEQRKPIIHNDYPHLPHKQGMQDGHAHSQRELVVPVFRSHIVVGIMGIGNKSIDYNNDDVERLEYLADILWELFESKQAEAKLENSRKFNEHLLTTIPFPMDIVDFNGNILFASSRMIESLGRNPTGETSRSVNKDDNKHTNDKIHILESSGAHRGKTFEVSQTEIIYEGKQAILEIFHDITDRKRIDAQLVQSDRMASMGMLAAGVAHEINNPLAYTLLNLENLDEILNKIEQNNNTKEAKEYLASSINGIDKVSKIVKNLSTFSRTKNSDIDIINVNESIEVALSMAFNEIKYKTKIAKDFTIDSYILANEGKLAQVFLNIILNASYSINSGDVQDNLISIKTWQNNNEIFISIQDTGCGISEENQKTIFNPFFTTKPTGLGTGLGLSITEGIIHSFGGSIDVQSKLNMGSTFTMHFPKAQITEIEKPKNREFDTTKKITGRVLIVDDDEDIRKGIGDLLEDCEVTLAESGIVAKDILNKNFNFDYIICDVMMPDVSGIDLYEWLLSQNKELANKVIFITGGAFTANAAEFIKAHENRKLDKPFKLSTLINLINKLKQE